MLELHLVFPQASDETSVNHLETSCSEFLKLNPPDRKVFFIFNSTVNLCNFLMCLIGGKRELKYEGQGKKMMEWRAD